MRGWWKWPIMNVDSLARISPISPIYLAAIYETWRSLIKFKFIVRGWEVVLNEKTLD